MMGQNFIFSSAATGRKQPAFNADNTLSSNRGANIHVPENLLEAFTIKIDILDLFEPISFLMLFSTT
jgi:hypothetical protein